jgi:hypothetical protein
MYCNMDETLRIDLNAICWIEKVFPVWIAKEMIPYKEFLRTTKANLNKMRDLVKSFFPLVREERLKNLIRVLHAER